MNEMTRIAVDAVGGDFGAPVVLEGVEMALAEDPNLEVVICGPADAVEPFAQSHDRCIAQPCTEEIAMDEHPAQAVRKKKDSSIVVGCRLVKEGQAQGFFSAGSTGACLTAATLVMGRIKGSCAPLSRPSSRLPRNRSSCAMWERTPTASLPIWCSSARWQLSMPNRSSASPTRAWRF